jgi:carbon storage regulator
VDRLAVKKLDDPIGYQRICRSTLVIGRNKEGIMLVLSRKTGESIVIDDNIQITVIAFQGQTVKLGIKAPSNVRVDRQEIHERRAEFDFEVSVPVRSRPVSTSRLRTITPDRIAKKAMAARPLDSLDVVII